MDVANGQSIMGHTQVFNAQETRFPETVTWLVGVRAIDVPVEINGHSPGPSKRY